MSKKIKPEFHQAIVLQGSIVGAIFKDEVGFFYRPKRNSIVKSSHNPKWDGKHFDNLKDCLRNVLGEDEL